MKVSIEKIENGWLFFAGASSVPVYCKTLDQAVAWAKNFLKDFDIS